MNPYRVASRGGIGSPPYSTEPDPFPEWHRCAACGVRFRYQCPTLAAPPHPQCYACALSRALDLLRELPSALEQLEQFDHDASAELKARVPGLAKHIADRARAPCTSARLLRPHGALGPDWTEHACYRARRLSARVRPACWET